MVPIDSSMIKARIKKLDLSYRKIEEASNGTITEISLKHFLNKGLKADEATLDTLAGLLDCSKNDLINKDYLLSTNLPFEINSIVGKLYLRNREDINCYYAEKIKEFRDMLDLKTMLNQAHRLFITLSSEDYIFDKAAFVKAFNIIGRDFVADKCISNMQLTGILNTVADDLYSKIIEASGDYNTHQVILMFLYVYILFDAIFLEEAVASATQLVPERKTNKANQYYLLSYKIEKMQDTLINFILYKGYRFDEPDITEKGIDDEVINGIAIMLAACEKCYQHIHGNFTDSEYINRATLSAVLSLLEKVFENIGIEIPQEDSLTKLRKMNTTRFGIHYNMMKVFFNALNPPRNLRNKGFDSFLSSVAYKQATGKGVEIDFGSD
ncbi:MAG: hypothetical protein LBO65_02185 [Spirochaetaceae bacterium]|jgi:hypothetical protein|nr:hypothetical protein [Spirochaetaceae bacterium]